jgi:prepilin-type N-terminal cleavage/methylation domain-containing protein
MLNRKIRKGFTLPEVLVTVAIIAILAAVVVPAVTQQIGKGDQGKFVSSVQGVQTGLVSYVGDVHRFPQYLSQLVNPVLVGDPIFASTATLTAVDTARWNGPYLQTDVAAVGDSLSLGYGLFARDSLYADGSYISFRVLGDTADIRKAAKAIDGQDGTGLIRYALASGNVDTATAYVRMATAK